MIELDDRLDSEICYQMKLVVDLRILQKTDNGGREVLVIRGSRIDIVRLLPDCIQRSSSLFEQMTYDHTEIDLEDSTPGNVSFIGSDRATVAGHRVIVKYVASKAVSLSCPIRTYKGLIY